MSTSARGLYVRIIDLEARSHFRFNIVDTRAFDVACAQRIDNNLDAVVIDDFVVIGDLVIKSETILEPRATAPTT